MKANSHSQGCGSFVCVFVCYCKEQKQDKHVRTGSSRDSADLDPPSALSRLVFMFHWWLQRVTGKTPRLVPV